MPWVVTALTFMSVSTQNRAAELVIREAVLLSQNTQDQEAQGAASAGSESGDNGGAAPQTVGQAPTTPVEKQPEVAALQQPGVLTPKGKILLEPGLQFAHSTDSRVVVLGLSVFNAVIVGLIDIRTVNRTSWVGSLTGRYGITNRWELETRVPYVYRSDTTVARPTTDGSADRDTRVDATGSGIGDVEVTTRYQFNEGGIEKPYYVGSLRFKSRTGKSPFQVQTTNVPQLGPVETELPTGSGFYALQPALTVLYPSDPAVLFGSINYLYNFSRDDVAVTDSSNNTTVNKVEPGNVVGFNFGLGLALNDRTSLSIGYDHAIVGKVKLNGSATPLALTTHVGSLIFGYAFRWSPKTNFNLSASIGVTRDAPDIQISLRFPHSF